MIQGQFGRADLLRVHCELNEQALDQTALLAGYTIKAKPGGADTASAGNESTTGDKSHIPVSAGWAPVPFWRVETQKSFYRTPLPQARGDRSKAIESGWSNRPVPRATTGTLKQCDVVQLLDYLTVRFESKSPDIPTLTDRIARGHPALPMPLQRKLTRPRVCVLIDRSRRLVPFWKWQDEWAERLCAELNSVGVEVACCKERSLPKLVAGKQQSRRWSINKAEAVLLLGDAGYAAGHPDRAWWRYMRYRVLGPQSAAWQLSPVTMPSGFYSGWDLLPFGATNEFATKEQQDSLDLLFTLASVAVRLEPGLVSELRELIAAPAALEALFWQHPNLSSDSSVAATLRTDAQLIYRNKFKSLCEQPRNGNLLASALAIIRQWRAELPEEIWFEEILSLSAQAHTLLSESQDLTDAHNFIAELARKGAGFPGGVAHEWVKRLFGRDPDIGAQPDSVQVALSQLWRAAHPHYNQPPQGYQPVEDLNKQETQWQLFVGGTPHGQLQIHERPFVNRNVDTPGSSIGQIRRRGAETVVQFDDQRAQILGGAVAVTDSARRVLIRTDCEEMTLATTGKPEWASAIGRDRFGLWVEIQIEPAALQDAKARSSQGAVTQRLRWIAPGEFWMGSPADEPGRWEDEGPQHRVRLTDGYWMFDTPVTQALWKAVMGKNPSYFISETRPVEQVSYEDAEAFLRQLNTRYPELRLSLPTEAQWEYACRAGSEQATYAGPMEITGERHAPVLSNIAWYVGNSSDRFELDNGYDSSDWPGREISGDRSGTHPVAGKQPNHWGLYDMLGNVLEWCDSGWADYVGGFQENPTGSEAAARVVRGGSWIYNARFVRAAFRGQGEPDYRNNLLGFRCLRVQVRE